MGCQFYAKLVRMIYLFYIITGSVAGLLSGLGIGGGFVVVPALAAIFSYYGHTPHDGMHAAVATSLAIMILTASVTLLSHHRQGIVLWRLYRQLLPGLLVGIAAGVLLASRLNTNALRVLFGLFALLVALRMFLVVPPNPSQELPRSLLHSLVGFVTGTIASMLGVGGGVIIVPYLTRYNVKMTEAASVSILVALTTAIGGTVSWAILNEWAPVWQKVPSPVIGLAVLMVGVPSMLFAPLGVKLAYRLPAELLKRSFALMLGIVALHMFKLVIQG